MNYDDIIREMPYGLERTTLRLLSNHRGLINFVERDRLLASIQTQAGLADVDDRKMRLAIQSLRAAGVRVCHAERKVNDRQVFGYYLAQTDEEYAAFRARYGSYAKTIFETIKAMDTGAKVSPSGEIEPPQEMAVQGRLI